MQERSERPYHHGDLRRAVIETAQNMLREDRGWQFTLREVARRAGVSHTAPYKHFPDKAALLAELGTLGFNALRDHILQTVAGKFHPGRAEFMAAARAYFDFGADNPSLYRLMFSGELDKTAFPGLDAAAMSAFAELVGILDRGQKAGAFKAQPVQGQAAASWALLHGFTMLAIDGQLLPQKVGPEPIDAVLTCMLEGLEADR
jgi:AcrR family transcriptional regulator